MDSIYTKLRSIYNLSAKYTKKLFKLKITSFFDKVMFL